MCAGKGFAFVQESALDTLADLLNAYVESLGRAANRYASLCGRQEGKTKDVLMAFREKHRDFDLAAFGQKLLEDCIESGDAFEYDVPHFPSSKRRKQTDGDAPGSSSSDQLDNAPSYFPDLPPQYTYQRTEMFADGHKISAEKEKAGRNTSQRQEQLKQNRLVQKALNRLYSNISSANEKEKKWGSTIRRREGDREDEYADGEALKKLCENKAHSGHEEEPIRADVDAVSTEKNGNRSKHELVISGRFE